MFVWEWSGEFILGQKFRKFSEYGQLKLNGFQRDQPPA